MKILITGAGGFLGKYLSNHLLDTHDIYAMFRSDLDLRDPQQVKHCFQNKYDAVIHCAASGRNAAKSTDPSILVDNLTSWNNLVTYKNQYDLLINVATGAEFDIAQNISLVRENDIWSRNPQHSYGQSKNIIARMAQNIDGFFNLRLFGCFDSSESDLRPIKRCQQQIGSGKSFVVSGDKSFDMVSVEDFTIVVRAVLAGRISDNDINVVYNEKHTLSETLKIYCDLQGFDSDLVQVESVDSNNYTGDGTRLEKYGLPLLGLEKSLERYL